MSSGDQFEEVDDMSDGESEIDENEFDAVDADDIGASGNVNIATVCAMLGVDTGMEDHDTPTHADVTESKAVDAIAGNDDEDE